MSCTIIGGGPSGLYFAIQMKKQNPAHNITIYERDNPNETFGWGIVFSQNTMNLFQANDPGTARAIADAAQKWDHAAMVHRGEKNKVYGNVTYGIRRITLLNILQQRAHELGIKIIFDKAIDDEAEVEALAQNCDLLVGADGVNSIVRRAYSDFFLPSSDLRQNKFVWLGTEQLDFSGLTLSFRQNDAGLFIGHAYPFSQAHSTFIVEVAPATWLRAGLNKMSDAETLAYCADVFKDDLGAHPLLAKRAIKWQQFPLLKNKHWHWKNIVLLGDALHTVHFSIGSGTKLAVEDAVYLARAFAQKENVADALKEFQRARKPMLDQYQAAAVQSLEWFENVDQHLHLDPVPFTYAVATRSNRVGYNRLKRQSPDFIAQVEKYRAQLPPPGPIPREFLDLFEKVSYGHLAVLMRDGTPHVSPVWVDYDGKYLLINSAKGRQKDLNMARHPDVALEIPDPDNPNRYVMVRGRVVEIVEEGADAHLDQLARRYLARDNYPSNWKFPGEVRRIYKIEPKHVVAWEPFG